MDSVDAVVIGAGVVGIESPGLTSCLAIGQAVSHILIP
jgi:hypothetical protein